MKNRVTLGSRFLIVGLIKENKIATTRIIIIRQSL
jgi:hypothetical protein